MFLPGSRWFLGSLEFLTDEFRNLSQQEPELSEVTGSGTGCLPPAPVQVGLTKGTTWTRTWLAGGDRYESR
jgi:hypothetical protein